MSWSFLFFDACFRDNSNTFFIYFRGTRNQSSLRELLQPLVQTVLDDTTLNTTTNPVEIYKNWINQTESDTGQAR